MTKLLAKKLWTQTKLTCFGIREIDYTIKDLLIDMDIIGGILGIILFVNIFLWILFSIKYYLL